MKNAWDEGVATPARRYVPLKQRCIHIHCTTPHDQITKGALIDPLHGARDANAEQLWTEKEGSSR